MKWLGKKSRTAIGLDVGERAVKAVQLSGSAGAWRMAATASIPCEGEGGPIRTEEVERLVHILDRQGFAGDRIVLAVPPENLLSGILELPPEESGAPRDQIARMELSSMHRVEPETIEVDFWPLPATGRQREASKVMAAACPHGEADALLDAFERGGMEIVALDTEAAAMVRACGVTAERHPDLTALIDLGWRSALIILLYRGAIIYERRLDESGVRPLRDALAQDLDLEPAAVDYLLRGAAPSIGEEADAAGPALLGDVETAVQDHYQKTVRELLVSVSYATHQYPEAELRDLLLLGGGAGIPGLPSHITDQTDLHVSTMKPADRVAHDSGSARFAHDPALTTALGLAMHPEGS